MRSSVLFLAIVFSGLAEANNAMAKECPVQFPSDTYVSDVAKVIEAQNSCDEAVDMAILCGMGSSIDIDIAGAARYHCEQSFVSKMTPQNLETYKQTLLLCEQKYRDMQGTLYLSAWAFCELNVSQMFNRLFTPAEE